MANMDKICRLCLNVLIDHLQTLNLSEEFMLKFILLDLDMTVSENPVICSQCLETLQQSHDFRMLCLKTENFLSKFYNTKEEQKLKLSCILKNDTNKVNCGNEIVCRFCLNYLETDSFMRLGKLDEDIFFKDMLHKCLPEFNLDITDQPIICLDCMNKLQTLFHFKMKCQDNDENMKRYIVANGTDSGGYVSLTDVLNFIEDVNGEDKKLLEIDPNIVKVEMVDAEIENSLDVMEGPFKREIDDEFEEEKEDSSLNVASKKILLKRTPRKKAEKKSRTVESKVVSKKTTRNFKELRCKLCPMTTRCRNALQKHMRTNHMNNRLYQCFGCNYATPYIYKLKNHISYSIHTYICKTCGFSTHSKRLWFEHRRIHKDAFLLSCEKCSKGFNTQLYLDRHILTQHPELEHLIKSKVFRCGSCRSKTVFKKFFVRHVCRKTYSCDQCNYNTTVSRCLASHKSQVHKNECQACKTRFTKDDFERHMREHEEQEYERLIVEIDEIMEKQVR